MAKKFERFGVMIDMSRNAVMTVESLKQYFILLKKMGYNSVMLYTEDTYEVEGEPYFGYMRGRYSIAEMQELDEYASNMGIELIPCIQTLAHLNQALRWGTIPVDCNDIMLTDDEKVYDLIDRMFKTLKKCFKSSYIHIGMDEAHMLGRGKHLDIHGYESTNEIIKRHLAVVCDIAKKYDYVPIIWSDMYFRSWNNGQYCFIEGEKKVPQEVVDAMHPDVIPVYWDYYSKEEKHYSDMIKNHKQISKNVWFAGGAWGWHGFTPFNGHTIETSVPAIDACKNNKIKNVFITMWGNDGCESSNYALLPSLLYIAEYAKGNTDEEKIKAKFKRITGVDYDDFMLLDKPNQVDMRTNCKLPPNPVKYMYYSDYFSDFLDVTVRDDVNAYDYYDDVAKKLYAVAKKTRKYGYLFDAAAKMCDVMKYKYELGKKTRAAYENGDKATLERLAKTDYVEVAKAMHKFGLAFEKQWYKENKPQGFDVQDHRIGGLIRRTEACRKRLLDYVAGRVDSIPEYEEKLLNAYGNEPRSIESFKVYSTVNVISH
ncbi:MAG: beta-N-acetylhexosaminidase [Clostridia bacterium]|nr:beta-N-acetylhexosaminidase [Clostridia bacterium]